MTAAIIVAAGSSRRMGFDKLMAQLSSRTVLEHSIEAFLTCADIDEVIVVTDESRFSRLVLDQSQKKVRRVEGGNERQDSVLNGLLSLGSDVEQVAIHDGARPIVNPLSISKVLAVSEEMGAASLARPVTDTLKRADTSQFVQAAVSRENLWAMETPQCFERRLILEAYRFVQSKSLEVTDEVSAVEAIGHAVKLVINDHPNPKVTYPGDLEIARLLGRIDTPTR
ncbi:MAG: 2-C-methyl-D-erythritol 4-phosphate cytidylyltransferase [Verrucomicrobiota bacterium JB023]|nr:2-C-methyl-D-erythritol 4-phosphate cytidylyltransferase [Verrucomicrobiota bacterium JB023]